MVDYEKFAEGVRIPGRAEDEVVIPPEEVAAAQAARREYLPLDHEKYQGIAAAKGYKQDDYSGNRLQRVHYSHEAMIEEMLINPTITQNDLAKLFGKSVGWISIVIGSDAFQAALAKRRDDVLDPALVASIEEKFRGLANQSLAVLSEKLEKTQNTDLALKSLDISVKALGFGARQGSGGQVNQFVIQLPPKAASAEEWSAACDPRKMKQLPSTGTEG
jgi:hypothetical protein